MEKTPKQIFESRLGLLAWRFDYSDNYIMSHDGELYIHQDLTETDCLSIFTAGTLKSIQFGKQFPVSAKTFELINKWFLILEKKPMFKVKLDGTDAVSDLECLRYMPNLKNLSVDVYNNDHIFEINRYTDLISLTLGGDQISLGPLVGQRKLEELFLTSKFKTMAAIGMLRNLKKVTFTGFAATGFRFLMGSSRLREVNFIFGKASNYAMLAEIGKIERLSFTMVNGLTNQHLLPINNMRHLKELKFDTQPQLTNFDWLTNKNVKTEAINCINIKK